MTRDELLARLQQDEGPLLERKESPQQRTPIIETLVGFANSTAPDQEAVLLIGQRGNKEIVGVEGVEGFSRPSASGRRSSVIRRFL